MRKSFKLEQTELAKKMGVSQAIISQYEGGMTEIPLSFLEYFKKKHRISSDWLIFGTGDNDLKRFEKYLKGALLHDSTPARFGPLSRSLPVHGELLIRPILSECIKAFSF